MAVKLSGLSFFGLSLTVRGEAYTVAISAVLEAVDRLPGYIKSWIFWMTLEAVSSGRKSFYYFRCLHTTCDLRHVWRILLNMSLSI